jgi:hypothetical protein
LAIAIVFTSVADPDVFGLSGSGFFSKRYGSGSFYYQAKMERKTLIPIFCDFFMTFFFEK